MSAKRPQGSVTGNDPESKIPAFRYTSGLANQIESKWQDHWESEGTFEAPNPAGPLAQPEKVAGREKLFVLDMFPYPSGARVILFLLLNTTSM
jgi:leucyl-tRNA synthetase